MAPWSLFLSHVLRCLAIAQVLRNRGHIVKFVACNKYKNLIEAKGFQIISCDYGQQETFSSFGAPKEYKKKYDLKKLNIKTDFSYFFNQYSKIREAQDIDLIIYDGGFCLYPAFFDDHIEVIEIKNHIGIFSHIEMQQLIENGVKRECEFDLDEVNETTKFIYKYLFDNKYLHQVNVTKFLNVPIIIPGITSFELADNVNYYNNKKFAFVGPFCWGDHLDEAFDIPDDKKVVMISFGSSFPFKKIIKTICSALNQEDIFIIINAGDEKYINENFSEYQNLIHKEFLNYDQILPHVDVIIHHAGHGTVMHALKFGVPCITIPFNGDQCEIARQIDNQKIGVRLKKYPDDITEQEILSALDQVLNDSLFSQNSQKISQILKSLPSPEIEAANFIENHYFEVQITRQNF
jgi:MGT family glycosyltransferase